ncbi:MAG: esterase [Mycobacterium sp.]
MRTLGMAALLAAGILTAGPGVVVAGAQTACADLGGTVDADQICRVHAAEPSYTLDFGFPVDYPDQRALSDYLTQTRDGFVNVSEMPDSRDMPYALDARGTGYRSGQPPGRTQSVVFEVYQNVGGPHPQTWYKAFNYDLVKGAPITYDTLFKPGTKPLDIIFPAVQRELEKQTGIDQPISPGDGLDPSNYQNFAVTDDAVIFFFGQGELLPGAAGATQASVPRTVLAPILAAP